jgi:hypothetical protein
MAVIVLLGSCGGSNAPPFNATPTITNLFPSVITAGSDSFTLSVVGTGFISSAKGVSFLYWNGFPRSTTLDQITGQLQVQIPASDVAAADVVNVTVVNPAPGGGMSTPSTFTIQPVQAGAPMVSGFSPTSAKAGGAAFALTVNGSNFAANDGVTWNGSVRTTTFVNSSQVTASITASDIASPGSASVAVYTPGFVVGSTSSNFAITGPNNPAPTISSLSPSSVSAGSPDLEVLVSGSGFSQSSFAEWNATPLATSFISSSQLMVLIPAADLTTSGTNATIDVSTPAPGGGTSKTLTFKVD